MSLSSTYTLLVLTLLVAVCLSPDRPTPNSLQLRHGHVVARPCSQRQ